MSWRTCFFLVLLLPMSACCATTTEQAAGQATRDAYAPTNDTERWLDSVIMTDVVFRAANCVDCLNYIQNRLDEYAILHKATAPRFVYDIEAARYLLDRGEGVPAATLPTLDAKKIPAYRLMKILGDICDIRFVVTPQLIVVEKKETKTANQVPEDTARKLADPQH